jgi:hypothetical protein
MSWRVADDDQTEWVSEAFNVVTRLWELCSQQSFQRQTEQKGEKAKTSDSVIADQNDM